MQLFARALAFNREQEKLDRAEAVALGISEAIDPEKNLLGRSRQALLRPGEEQSADPAALKPDVMASLFGGLPLSSG